MLEISICVRPILIAGCHPDSLESASFPFPGLKLSKSHPLFFVDRKNPTTRWQQKKKTQTLVKWEFEPDKNTKMIDVFFV